MTSVEKSKKKKSGKKKKKKESESEVLERVMDSIEMAGASLDFFDGDSDGDEKATEPDASADEAATLKEHAPESETDAPAVEAQTAEVSEEDALMEPITEEFDTEESDGEQTMQAAEGGETESVDADTVEASGPMTADFEDDSESLDMLAEENNNVEFIEQKQALSIMESLLFSSERPLGIGTFKQVFKGTNLKTKDIKKLLEDLQVEYADVARGVSLEEINGGWQLRTKVDNMEFLRKLAKARPFKLSGPALEVLAIIAYKQPMIKSEVDDIRGVESGHLVRALMEKHLVCFQGKSELPGKPMQYGTTRKFLEIFGLRNLRELPSLDEIDQLLPDGIGLEEEDEKLSDVTDKMAEEFDGSYSESAEELEKIENTLGGIDTSSEFFEEEKRRQKEKRDRDRAQDIREALDVGEDVDSKDQKWLARYDERIALEKAEAEAAAELQAASEATDEPSDVVGNDGETPTQEAAGDDESGVLLSDELSELTSESQQKAGDIVPAEVLAADQAMDAEDDELSAAGINDSETSAVAESSDSVDDQNSQNEGQEFDPFAEDEDSP